MIKLYNTLTRKLEDFKPIKNGFVGIYSCGPTVYWNQHIGHMYAYVQWDALIRFLGYSGFKTKWVMNITDVGHMTSDEDTGQDKMEKGAKRENLSVWEIADKYIKQFTESLDLLNIKRPDILCRATGHIKEQIDLIKKIEKNGFAYKTKTGLVFDTSRFPGYAKFARLNLKDQFAGARTEIDKEKKKPWDFLLWVTNQPNHIMQWDSPWNRGFPGWHIECTAMSTKHLGKVFDIHTGGKEHIPIHHTNEIAQAFGAFGKRTANFWLHNEWLTLEGEKMSKSLGNNVLVTDLIAKGFNPLALRYLIMTSHYRQGLNFTWRSLKGAEKALIGLYMTAARLWEESSGSKSPKDNPLLRKKYTEEFVAYLSDDLNVAKCLGLIWKVLKDKNLSFKDRYELSINFDKVFGLRIAENSRPSPSMPPIVIPSEVEKLVEQRENLRKEKQWQEADQIRKEVERLGWQIEDATEGPKIKPKS
ncbi:MAG: cysteine--tRNA ligase [bacterium]|nr:cysteine--tRNA ligase [bacterium]